ncbi:MAG: EVE domain-containing protein [Alphaproteobacteria bacterium]
MAYWLVKSEPGAWSWDDMVRAKRTEWDGVRNHQAKLNLMAMKKGDTAFFYHSGDEKAVVGTVEVVKEAYPDDSDPTGTFVMVDVKALAPMPRPVSLAAIKADPRFKDFGLVRFSRLSVVPVDAEHWKAIAAMGGAKG